MRFLNYIILKFLLLVIAGFSITGLIVFSSNIALNMPMFCENSITAMLLGALGIVSLEGYFFIR